MEATDYNNALNYDLAVIQLAEDVGESRELWVAGGGHFHGVRACTRTRTRTRTRRRRCT